MGIKHYTTLQLAPCLHCVPLFGTAHLQTKDKHLPHQGTEDLMDPVARWQAATVLTVLLVPLASSHHASEVGEVSG